MLHWDRGRLARDPSIKRPVPSLVEWQWLLERVCAAGWQLRSTSFRARRIVIGTDKLAISPGRLLFTGDFFVDQQHQTPTRYYKE